MGRALNLLIVPALVAIAVISQGSAAEGAVSSNGCTGNEQTSGLCTSGQSGGGSATVTGKTTKTTRGHKGSGSDADSTGTSTGSAATTKPLTCDTVANCEKVIAAGGGGGYSLQFHTGPGAVPGFTDPRLRPLPVGPAGDDPTPDPAEPAEVVTLTDVARFLPAQGAVHSEPDGWAIVGDPIDFWVDVTGPQVVDGKLLGMPAQVRFTPDRFVWSYGDGDGRISDTAGASWADLGQRQFSTTATSHVYADRGHDDVTVQIAYTADYRVDGGAWLPVRGLVFGRTAAAPVLVVREGTVLTPN